ncbi:citrate synthase [Noviherbaspirillum malthae]|uniref:citrate synthase n=1 Tax=Noviherbaspirillum malthae TaxID=1260987 RepID=UPI00188F547D|nr:citrate synthase [Noviherbaspirillum malthae]
MKVKTTNHKPNIGRRTTKTTATPQGLQDAPTAQRPLARQINDVEYLEREEVLALLEIKKESLYTYVSRGLIKTAPHGDSRRRLYLKSDVEKLKSRAADRVGGTTGAAPALRYGEPIVQTWVCEITDEGPRYRGYLAVELARDGRTFESVAELLWTGIQSPRNVAWASLCLDQDEAVWLEALGKELSPCRATDYLAMAAARMGASGRLVNGKTNHNPIATGTRLIQVFSGISGLLGPERRFACPPPGQFIARTLVRELGGNGNAAAVAAESAINAALVLSADNELTAPTFAARICASTGADLSACVASAIHVQSGPMQVGGTEEVEWMFDNVAAGADGEQLALSTYPTADLPCFYHPLYARDRRAELIVSLARQLTPAQAPAMRVLEFIDRIDRENGQYPNLYAALVTLSVALGFPKGSAALIHTIGRTAGWIAHSVEQQLNGAMLRPRAKYMGARR